MGRVSRPPRSAPAPHSIGRIVDHYDEIVRRHTTPPLLIGHSFGGLFVQMLLDRGLGAAGIAICPVAPRGVVSGIAALKNYLPYLFRWNGWSRTSTITWTQFSGKFAQSLGPAERRAVYASHIVPAPGRIFYEAALGLENRVNFANDFRAPLLLIAAENDRMIRSSLVASTYRKHLRSAATTAFKSFTGRSHWLIAERGWEDVADYGIEWGRNASRVAEH